VSAAEYYRERNRKIRRVLQAHFGKQNVSVTPGWELGRVTARIDSDLDTGELIDLVRKLIVHAGPPAHGRPFGRWRRRRAGRGGQFRSNSRRITSGSFDPANGTLRRT